MDSCFLNLLIAFTSAKDDNSTNQKLMIAEINEPKSIPFSVPATGKALILPVPPPLMSLMKVINDAVYQ